MDETILILLIIFLGFVIITSIGFILNRNETN